MDGHGTVPSVPSVPRRINDLSSGSDKEGIGYPAGWDVNYVQYDTEND